MSLIVSMLGEEGFGAYEVTWGSPNTFTRVVKAPDLMLVPGFVDLHLHGAFGLDFTNATAEEMLTLAGALEREGYEAFLPTTVTSKREHVVRALQNLPFEDPRIPGFHLEGPFISPAYPGAQPSDAIAELSPGPSEWDDILDDPRLRVITLAPEIPHALERISKLSQRGVVVSMGHSNATYDEARRGFEFGATHTTHTFNAMRPFHHREAGLVGYALTNRSVNCELIYDRVHVGRDAAHLLLQVKGETHVIAVSDSTAATRLAPGTRLEMWGHHVEVGRDDVRLVSGGALAGSTITLLDAFRNLFADFGPERAIRLCSLNPRRALGMSGEPRVYVLMDKKLQIEAIFENGKQIH